MNRKEVQSKATTHPDHNADRGHDSMSHYNMVHNRISFFKAVEITATQIAMDREIGVSGERN